MNQLFLGALLFAMGEAIRLRSAVEAAVQASSLGMVTEECPDLKDTKDLLHNFPLWLAYTIAVVGILIGLFENMFGYKYWALTVFIVCGYICGSIVYAIVLSAVSYDDPNIYWYAYGAGAGAGLIGGLVFSALHKFAAFLIGAGLGVILAYFLQPLALAWIWSEQPNTLLYIMMGVLGVLFGVLVLCMERPIVIVSTASVGAFVVIYGIGQLAGGLPSIASSYWKELASHGIKCVYWQQWAYLGGLAALALLGVIVQFAKTAKDIDHKRAREQKNLQQQNPDAQRPLYGGAGTRYV